MGFFLTFRLPDAAPKKQRTISVTAQGSERPMNKNNYQTINLLVFLLGFVSSAVEAAEQVAVSPKVQSTTAVEDLRSGTFTKKGADTCIKCHDEDSEYPVFDIFKTKHGQKGDKRSPFAQLQCEACHGPGAGGANATPESLEKGGHVGRVRPGHKRPPILNFGFKSDVPAEKQNAMCLTCHQADKHAGWKGSPHEAASVACANCHTIHAAKDPVLANSTQPDVCFKCHKKQREEFFMPSVHPVRFGQMGCAECHNVHGSVANGILVKPTLNQTCYTCHAEKRGPFTWEHAPVTEDCSLCHRPHGSVNPALLKKRPPFLCQQCHSQLGHPGISSSVSRLPGGAPSGFLLGGACLNCHSQVHGSNHPSGVKLMR